MDLLIALVHKVNVRAERPVEGELREDLRRVRNKQGLLYALAEAALTHPEETVRVALYPVVAESTLRDLVREATATDAVFRARVRTVLSASYSGHYRRMLPRLFHGQRGELRQRYREGQEDQLGALGLVLNAVVLWNTRYTDAALAALREQGYPVLEADAAYLSPFGRRAPQRPGRYAFTPPAGQDLRPLRDPAEPAETGS